MLERSAPSSPNRPAAGERPARYRTGDEALDARIGELVGAIGDSEDADLLFEMLVSVARMGREGLERLDLKIANTTLKELRYAFRVFEPEADVPKVTMFGSARLGPDHPDFQLAKSFATAMVEQGWQVITGGGPGIMTAGIEGAGRDKAFGVNILLPFEPTPSIDLLNPDRVINFRYFFTRKLTFLKEASGFCLCPGGFGTLDEAFELLTLLQTGRTEPAPVVLLAAPGNTYWESWRTFVEREMAAPRLILPDDLTLIRIAHTVEEAVEEITSFHRCYHSMRYVGRRLVLRLKRVVGDEELVALNHDFADIVESGGIERTDPLPAEIEDDDLVHLPRLVFRFDRRSFARLRQLIDRLNRGGIQP